MNIRPFAIAALVASSSGMLTGCGTLATSAPVAQPAPIQAPELVSGTDETLQEGSYTTQGVTTGAKAGVTSVVTGGASLPLPERPICPPPPPAMRVVFQDSFEKASQESLDKVWLSTTDFRGNIPMIYPAPTSYQLVKPGLGKSLVAVAAGGGKAFSANRFNLELRQTLLETRSSVGAKRHLAFRFSPFVVDGPIAPGQKRPSVQTATAPLVLEGSLNGKTWFSLWDSRHIAVPMSYPAPTELDAQVSLPAGNLKVRFVTLPSKAGQPTPRIDDVVISEEIRPLPAPISPMPLR